MRYVRFLVPLLVACSGGTKDAETDTDGVTDTPGTTDTAPACTAPTEGPWEATGSCFGMLMTATLTVGGADGCRFTFDEWNMQMSVPEGGRVDGTDVTLTGPGWDDCTGTTDGTSIEGSCGDGCTYEMTYEG